MKTKDMKTGDVIVATRGYGVGIAVVVRPEVWNDGYARFQPASKKYNHSKGTKKFYESANGVPVIVVTRHSASIYSGAQLYEKIIEKAKKEAHRLAKMSEEDFAEAMNARSLRYGLEVRVAPPSNFTHTVDSINEEHRAHRAAQENQRSAEQKRRERQDTEVAVIREILAEVGADVSIRSRYDGSVEIGEKSLTELARAIAKLGDQSGLVSLEQTLSRLNA